MDDMNCLAARRIITTDITDKSSAFVSHVNGCPTCKSFYEKQLKFNSVLKKAVDVDVPEGLAARILVEHNLNKKKEKEGANKFRWSAIAASVILVFAVSIVSTINTPPAIAEVILEHAHEELWVLEDKGHVTLESLNQLLKPHGVRANENIGYATHAGNCVIQDQVGVHIVFAGENAPVTLIVFPKELDNEKSVRISDHFFKGVLMNTNKGTLAILSEDEESLKLFEARLNSSLMTFI
ncbi:MAG: DUF3379 family protein [Gammaproteobacteria bacterium]|nr:DUF3379 family protein [Gammaproteobacteria bacterium]